MVVMRWNGDLECCRRHGDLKVEGLFSSFSGNCSACAFQVYLKDEFERIMK